VRLRILGTRGNIQISAPGHVKHSGILIDNRLLLDVGEKEYLNYRPRWIFITHLHSDHMAVEAGANLKRVLIYAPESSRLIPKAEIVSSKAVVVGPYEVTPIPTVHSQRVKSVGYVVRSGTEKIFYSSDMIRIESDYHRLLQNLDLVITEGSFIRSKGLVRIEAETGEPFGHNGIPDLVEFFSQFTRRIIITHLGTWYFKDIAKSRTKIESFSNRVRITPAYDGMAIDLRAIKRAQQSSEVAA
jgi:ribonuclease BN (tRNA processing enzyme)